MKSKHILTILFLLIIIGLIIYFVFIKDNSVINNAVQNKVGFNSNSFDDNNDNTSNFNLNEETENYKNKINQIKDDIQNDSEKENKNIISTFSTEIKDDSPGRVTNIGITCELINGTIVNPGDTFSFNEIVGQPSVDRGYQEATVIIDGEHEDGIGGGNCQVSSTLYNAVLLANNLAVIERHEHGGSGVTYVPAGQDATVSYGSNLDFKFRNDNPYKIKINLGSDGKKITAEIAKVED